MRCVLKFTMIKIMGGSLRRLKIINEFIKPKVLKWILIFRV